MFTATMNSAYLHPPGRMKIINPEELLSQFHRFNNFHTFGVAGIPKLNYALSFSTCKIGVIVCTLTFFLGLIIMIQRIQSLDWESRELSSIRHFDQLHRSWANHFSSVSSSPK